MPPQFAGALLAGSPETVAAKIVTIVKGLGLSRLDMKYSAGTLPHPLLMRSIELYGTKVAPRVRELLADAKYQIAFTTHACDKVNSVART